MDAGLERAIAAQREAILQFGEAYEDEGKEGAGVPVVIEENVQVIECVLVEEVRLVEEGVMVWKSPFESAREQCEAGRNGPHAAPT